MYNKFMETLFQDDYINNVVLKRLIKEVKKGQIARTIRNIDYYNKIRQKLDRKYNFSPSLNQELENLKRKQNAKRSMQA